MNITVNVAKTWKGKTVRFDYPTKCDDEVRCMVARCVEVVGAEERNGSVCIIGRDVDNKRQRTFRAEFIEGLVDAGECETVFRVHGPSKRPTRSATSKRRAKARRAKVVVPESTSENRTFGSFTPAQIPDLEQIAFTLTLALYDPVRLDKPADVIDADLIPATLEGKVDMLREYNELAIKDPELFGILGLFWTTDPQLGPNILD